MWGADSFEKTLGKIEGRRRRGRHRMRWLDGIIGSMDMGLGGLRESWWWTRRSGVLWFMGSQRVRHNWVTELNWTEWLKMLSISSCDYWPSACLFWRNVCSNPLLIFLIELFSSLLLNYNNSLCILDVSPLSDMIHKYFLTFCGCLFTFLSVSFEVQIFFILMKLNLSTFLLLFVLLAI